MNGLDLRYICREIGDLTGIPVRLFDSEDEVLFRFIAPLPKDPMVLYKDDLWKIDGNVGYFATEDLSCYGVVNAGSFKIVVGPTRQIPNSDQELHELAFRLDITAEETQAFIAGMKSIARTPYEQTIQLLCLLNYLLNGEKLSVKDVGIHASEQELLQRETRSRAVDKALSDSLDNVNIQSETNNSIVIEDAIMNIVSHGDMAALQEWLSAVPAVHSGTVAADQLRQRKNLFICTATLASRAAIRGGLNADDALALSDRFIQSCELLNSPDRITNLQYHMIVEYTERVERIRKGKSVTKLSIAVANYIQRHLSEPFTTEAIAAALFMSRTHLSRKFKEETGETLTDFILKEKTEEAKRLLRYTDKTSAAVSAYLGFSSQGHFSRTFKKYAGCRPKEYREKYTR